MDDHIMSFCKDCTKGVIHEGTPHGKWETIAGIECYVSTPTVDYPKDKIVLFLADAYGPQLVNNQLLADSFAESGFKVIMPDYLNGDGVPLEVMAGDWLSKHTQEQTRPPLDKVITALKESGVSKFGATGYCFGGRYVFDLAFENIIQVGAVAHPSLLKVPEDLKKYAANSEAPLLINSCTYDIAFPLEAQAKADELLGGGKLSPGYKREYWEGCTHGFAVRGDLSDPKVKAGKEGAFKATVEWFVKYL